MRKLVLAVSLFIFAGLCFAQSNTYGPTTKNDQTWQIAILVRPDASVSIQQTMLALLKANPNAFSNNNVYQLNPGVTLKIPSLSDIQSIDANNALQQVAAQEKAWQQQTKTTKKYALKPIKIDTKNSKLLTNQLKQMQMSQQKTQKLLTDLQMQYQSVGKTLMTFDQQYQQRIAEIEKQNSTTQTQLKALQTQLTSLQSSVTQMQQKPSGFMSSVTAYIQSAEKAYGTNAIKMLLIAVTILILLLIFISIIRRRKKLHKLQQDLDTKSEYDFMGSQEGVGAKLDLARAYIDMGDKQAAKAALEEVMQKGDEKQIAEAKTLMEKTN